MRIKLLEQGATLTLDQALTILRTAEAATKQSSNLKHGETAAIQVTTSSYKQKKQQQSSHRDAKPKSSGKPATKRNNAPSNANTGCWNCGAAARCNPLTSCPAQGQECNNCNRTGHFAKVCLQPRRPKPTHLQSIFVDPPPSIGSVTSHGLVSLRITPRHTAAHTGRASGHTVLALPDTGADLNAISEFLYFQNFSDTPLRPGVHPCTAVGSPITSLGMFQATVDWIVNDTASKAIDTTIHVLRELKQPVLSKKSQQALHMLPPGYPHTYVSLVTGPVSSDRRKVDLDRLMGEFPTIFDGKCRPMAGPPCHFQLTDGAKPVALRGSRPVSVPLLPRLKAEFQSLEEAGIIRKVTKPTAWVHPIVVVPEEEW